MKNVRLDKETQDAIMIAWAEVQEQRKNTPKDIQKQIQYLSNFVCPFPEIDGYNRDELLIVRGFILGLNAGMKAERK